jgi:hypothetical protein
MNDATNETPRPPADPPLPAAPAAASQDEEHLRLLSIFHYVVAALSFLIACIPLIHFGVGALMATGRMDDAEPAMAAVGCLFMAFSAALILAGWAYAVLLVVAGRSLVEHRRYMLCMVMAAISCAFAPVGTVLGVFTLIVLVRPSVKALFTARTGHPAA